MGHQLAIQCRNLWRITYLELLWGFRIPESVIYSFLTPSLILLLLGLAQARPESLRVLVPGLIALAIASSSMRGVGTTVSFMRAYGAWRTLQASPIPLPLYLAGLIGSRLLRTVLVVVCMLGVAALLGYRLEISPALLLVAVPLGAAVFAALGLFLSQLVRSPQAASGLMNLVLLPMIFTSDILYVSRTPWIQGVASLLPLRYLSHLIRGDGQGAGGVNLAILCLWLVLASGAALLLSRKRREE